MELNELKGKTLNRCIEIIEDKIVKIKAEINNVQESANEETKSSAGDKYETARAMAMIEKENLGKQLAELLKQYQILKSIIPGQNHHKTQMGSLIHASNDNYYFVAISLGFVSINKKTCIVISPVSPLGKVLTEKVVGEKIEFNNQEMTLLDFA
ncbi:MAG TPA: 3-oxoacyl-ACP synthase [Cyclobacteriaceae bacterium]